MPEIAAIGLVGAIITFIAVNFNLYWVHRSFDQPAFRTLNRNLEKIGKYWSNEQGRIIEVVQPTIQPFDQKSLDQVRDIQPTDQPRTQEDLQKLDYQKSTRSAFIFGTMMIFLSWFGLFLFLLYFLSTNKLAKSRLEQRIFSSDLVSDDKLASTEVRQILESLEQL